MSWTDLIAVAEVEDLAFRLEDYFHKVDVVVAENVSRIIIHGTAMDKDEANELLHYLNTVFMSPPRKKPEEELVWKEGLILDQLISEDENERTESATGNGAG